MATRTLLSPAFRGVDIPNRPLATIACLAAADSAALLCSVGLGVLLKAGAEGVEGIESYLKLWPFLFVFLVVYGSIGLYSIVALSPPEELRRATTASAVLFLLLGAITVSFRGGRQQFTWTLFAALGFSVVFFPLMRAFTRQLFAARSWWGYPAVIFGAGEGARRIVRVMEDDPAMSLKPVAMIDDELAGMDVAGLPVLGGLGDWQVVLPGRGQVYGVFAAQDLPAGELGSIIERYRKSFSHILVVPELNGMASLWVSPKNVGGMLGLEVSQNRIHDRAKRLLDLGLSVLFAVVAGPLCALIAVLIRLDSRRRSTTSGALG